MPPLEILRASIGQLDEACRLFAGYLGFYGRQTEEASRRDFIAARLQNGDSVIFLAYQDGIAVGFMQLVGITNTRDPDWRASLPPG